MVIVGLTGGIACGKSTVVNEFKKLGTKIIDADKIAHWVLRGDLEVKKKILNNFGKAVLDKKGEVDRKKLGKIVFKNRSKLKLLEKITHPTIIAEIKKQIRNLSTYQLINLSTVVILDAPLLFEAKLSHLVDKIIVVAVPKEIQLNRLMKRDGLKRWQAKRRISLQWGIERKLRYADYVIDNTQPLRLVRKEIQQIWETLNQR